MTVLALAGPCLGLAARLPSWMLQKRGSPGARRIERLAYAAFARSFGLQVETIGKPPPPGTLIVANQISWADIPVFGAVADADFVAQSDIAGWPGIGALARRAQTLFVERTRRTASADQASAIARRLEDGRSVLLFAEGTTSTGSGVLPFRSSLFAAAQAAKRIQPATIAYLSPEGRPLDPERLREIAWTGGDRLLPSAILLARQPALAQIHWLEPIDKRDFPDRKRLAKAAHDAVATTYAAANRSR